MKNKAIYLKFIMVVLVSGTIGGLCGMFVGGNEDFLKELASSIGKYLETHAGNFQVALGIIMMIVMIIMLAIRYVRFKELEKNEELLESFEIYINLIITVNSVHMVLQFIFYGMYINTIANEEVTFYVPWFLGMVVFITAIQVYCISQIKKYNPIRKGNPFDIHFQKKWVESCDEAEKYVTYAAAYHTNGIMCTALRITAAVLMLCNMAVDIGVFPFVVVGVLWLIQVISHFFWVKKLSSQKINY